MNASLKSRMAEFLDAEQVEELRSIPGEGALDLFADLTQLFLRTTPELLQNLAGAVGNADAPAVARQAHMLKGSSSNLGAFRLSEKSHQMERNAYQGQIDPKLFAELEKDYADLKAILEEILLAPPETD